MKEARTIKIWTETYRRLRRIVAETDETLVELLERLAIVEEKRVVRKSVPRETIDSRIDSQ